nr:DUF6542 domain-containing protein [Antrihabitans stalactiti]
MAVLVAVGATFLGFLLDSARGDDLTGAFSTFYVLGCVVAVLAVRHRGLFTAVVQPPLILFVAVPLAYQYFTEGGGSSLKDILLNVAIPLVNRFPLMLGTTVVVLVIGIVRWFIAQSGTHAPARSRSRRSPDSGPAARRPRSTRTPRRTTRTAPASPPQSARKAPPEDKPRREPRSHAADTARPVPAQRTAAHARVARDYPARDYPARDYTLPPTRRAASEGRRRAETPAHPSPQVRYRYRDDPPYSR